MRLDNSFKLSHTYAVKYDKNFHATVVNLNEVSYLYLKEKKVDLLNDASNNDSNQSALAIKYVNLYQ